MRICRPYSASLKFRRETPGLGAVQEEGDATVAQRLGGVFIPEVSGPGGATLSCTCYGQCSSLCRGTSAAAGWEAKAGLVAAGWEEEAGLVALGWEAKAGLVAAGWEAAGWEEAAGLVALGWEAETGLVAADWVAVGLEKESGSAEEAGSEEVGWVAVAGLELGNWEAAAAGDWEAAAAGLGAPWHRHTWQSRCRHSRQYHQRACSMSQTRRSHRCSPWPPSTPWHRHTWQSRCRTQTAAVSERVQARSAWQVSDAELQ
jgi:hypothetical protein